MNWKCISSAVAVAALLAPSLAQADSISSVEGGRAKERQGAYLTSDESEGLRHYGGNDDYRYRYGHRLGRSFGAYDDGYYYDDGPSVGIYIGPGY